MGATLFDRGAHPIELTAAGRKFRPVAEEVLRRLLQSRDEIRQVGLDTESLITFSATHSLSLGFFPKWISGIEGKTHFMRTRLDSNQVGNCVLALVRGECQFMLCHTHPSVETGLPPENFTSVVVGVDRLLPVSAPKSDGSPSHSLPGNEANPVDYLAYVGTSAIGRAVNFMLSHHDAHPSLNHVFDTLLAAVLKTVAVQGRGLAWLPENEIASELETGKLVVSGDETFFIPVEIRLFRNCETLSVAAEEFWATVLNA